MTNILPRAGGTLDQDPKFMEDLRIIMNIEAQVENSKLQTSSLKSEIAENKGKIRSKL